MKAIVRDDIILLSTYVNAEFKYKRYLELIQKAGNYCFLDQFKKLIDGGENIVRNMVENNLIATENLNNSYKYIYLTDTAVKYLELRDSEEDYSDVKKNRISVKKVKKNPTQKQLFSSAFKFHLLANGECVDKDSILKSFSDSFFKQKYMELNIKETDVDIYKTLKNIYEEIRLLELKKAQVEKDIMYLKRAGLMDYSKELEDYRQLELNRIDVEKQLKEKSQNIFGAGLKKLEVELENAKLLENYAKKIVSIKQNARETLSKSLKEIESQIKLKENEITNINAEDKRESDVVAKEILPKCQETLKVVENLYDISKVIARIKDKSLEFIILDAGNFKTAYGYLKQVNSIKELKLGIEDINIIIYSYAKNRGNNLLKEFERVEKDKEKALKTMESFNIKTNNSPKKSDFYIAAEKVYDNTPNFNVEVRDDLYYIAKYISAISDLDKSIKLKDKKAIENLINKLNTK